MNDNIIIFGLMLSKKREVCGMNGNLLYQKIIDELRAEIESGALKTGDRIPTVNELRGRYEVSHITVLRAYRELQDAGFIVQQGKRYVVNTRENRQMKKNHNCIGLLVRPLWPYNDKDIYFNEINYGIQDECCISGINYLTPAAVRLLNQHVMVPLRVFEDIGRSAREIAGMVDGFLIDERLPDSFVAGLMEDTGKPCTVIDRLTTLPIDSVTPPNREAVRLLCSTALRYGYRKFIFVENGHRTSNMVARKEAFLDFIENNAVPSSDFRLIEDWSVKTAQESLGELDAAFSSLAKGEKTAVISSNDSYAREAYGFLFGKGLRPHLDFGVTGIDGLGTAYHPRPILTTVRTNTEEMGRMAVKSLLERIMKSPGAPATSLSPSPIFECGETL